MAVRAKVICTGRNTRPQYDGTVNHEREVTADGKCHREFTFGGVYSQDPNHENKVFTDHTPSLEVKMTVTNADVDFEPGKEYYLDFVRAPDTMPYQGPKFHKGDRVRFEGREWLIDRVKTAVAGETHRYDLTFGEGIQQRAYLSARESDLVQL